jgi:hypothetical protein
LQTIGVDCNLTIAVSKKSVGPLPKNGVGREKALRLDEVSPARHKIRVKGRERSEGREFEQGRCEDRVGGIG